MNRGSTRGLLLVLNDYEKAQNLIIQDGVIIKLMSGMPSTVVYSSRWAYSRTNTEIRNNETKLKSVLWKHV